jgi:hypothetical protein
MSGLSVSDSPDVIADLTNGSPILFIHDHIHDTVSIFTEIVFNIRCNETEVLSI